MKYPGFLLLFPTRFRKSLTVLFNSKLGAKFQITLLPRPAHFSLYKKLGATILLQSAHSNSFTDNSLLVRQLLFCNGKVLSCANNWVKNSNQTCFYELHTVSIGINYQNLTDFSALSFGSKSGVFLVCFRHLSPTKSCLQFRIEDPPDFWHYINKSGKRLRTGTWLNLLINASVDMSDA